jgi:hypothetical protein
MRRSRIFSQVFVVAAITACADPTSLGPSTLHGTWISARETLSSRGAYETELEFTAAGRFRAEVRNYLLYPNQREPLSSYERTEGTYRVTGDTLVFEPQRLTWWDRFYGDNSPVHVEEPYPYTSLFDGARFVVQSEQLTLRYTSYPADAPVETTAFYARRR